MHTCAYLSLYLILTVCTECDQPKYGSITNNLQNKFNRFSDPVSILLRSQGIIVCLTFVIRISIAKVCCTRKCLRYKYCSLHFNSAAVGKILALLTAGSPTVSVKSKQVSKVILYLI